MVLTRSALSALPTKPTTISRIARRLPFPADSRHQVSALRAYANRPQPGPAWCLLLLRLALFFILVILEGSPNLSR